MEWACCDGCGKWRVLSPETSADSLPSEWYCSLNTWDAERSHCDAPEQIFLPPSPLQVYPEWAQCEKCDKWRALPLSVAPDSLPNYWTCSLNAWDPLRNHCGAPQQYTDEDIDEGRVPPYNKRGMVVGRPASEESIRRPKAKRQRHSSLSPPFGSHPFVPLTRVRSPYPVRRGNYVYLVTDGDEAAYYGIWCPVTRANGGSLLIGRTIRKRGGGSPLALVLGFEGVKHHLRYESTAEVKVDLGDYGWELLQHGGRFNRNDAGVATAASSIFEGIGDREDSDEVVSANASWMHRRRTWQSGSRSDVSLGSDHQQALSTNSDGSVVLAQRGLPPIGCVLDVLEPSSPAEPFVLRCARMWYPEDCAKGREPRHAADELFIALESETLDDGTLSGPENEIPPRWRLVIVDFPVQDLSTVLFAPVSRHGSSSRGKRLAGGQWALEWACGYSIQEDQYLSLGIDLTSDPAGKTSADLCRLEDAVAIPSPAGCFIGGKPAGSSLSFVESGIAATAAAVFGAFPMRHGAIGRLVLVEFPCPGGCDEQPDWRLGRVVSYNSHSGEHFVEFDGEHDGKWADLKTGRWVVEHAPERPRLSWLASDGCWLAVQGAQAVDSSGSKSVFPLGCLLASLEKCIPEAFELPQYILDLPASGECPEGFFCRVAVQGAPAAERSCAKPKMFPLIHLIGSLENATPVPFELPPSIFGSTASGEGDMYSSCRPPPTPGHPHVSSPREEPESCARSRLYCKDKHHLRHTSATHPAPDFEPCAGPLTLLKGGSDSKTIPPAVALSRGSRSARGTASSSGTDGRLGVRNRRLRFGRSRIQGWGVYTDEVISAGGAVIEYRGVVIGNAVADARELQYRSEKRDDYMFRLDDLTVVDATRRGSLARYLNHSCEPNCFTQIIEGSSKKHIVIYALREINAGEELVYDYKFAVEEDAKKLPCRCGAKKCRGSMN